VIAVAAGFVAGFSIFGLLMIVLIVFVIRFARKIGRR
jgi:hypothetical protein